MIKYKLFFLLSVAFLSSLACSKKVYTPVDDNFNLGWQFYKSADTLMTPLANANWEVVNLPHTANVEQLTVKDQWQGICYYQKSFKLDSSFKDKVISIQFDAAMNVADVWINREKMAHHLGGYLPFVIDLTKVARFDTLNTVLVRLDNRDNPVTGPKPLKILDFNMYGGLYRNVHLIVKEKVHLSNPIQANVVAGGGVFFSTTSANKKEASFEIKSHIVNENSRPEKISVTHYLIDKDGKIVSTLKSESISVEAQKDATVVLKGNISTPQLWSPSTPNLYTLKTEVLASGQITDIQTNRVGIRTIQITPEGLCLNGEKTFLRGVNRHQEYPYIGYALSDAAQYRDAYKIKQAGFDYVRCSHYPMSPAFLDACDELGIMVLDAILGWQYFGDKEFEKLALKSSRELIRRDRNHPCILGWELSINESGMPKSFTDSAQIIAHEEYPYSGCYSAGWVLDSYDIYIEARQHRHGLHPEKPLLVSEYGDWEYYAQNAGFNQQAWKDLMEEERTSRQPRFSGEKRMLQQALNIQEAHNDNLSTHAFADGYWVMFDYNRGMAPDQEYSGVSDIFRLPKFSYYFFKSQRNYSPTAIFAEPVVFIASYWQPGESKSVRVFSNCDEVELFVDGKSVGKKKPDQNSITSNLYHPPFSFDVACTKPGTLKAIGYIGGKSMSEYSVSTPSTPEHLNIKVDESGVSPTLNDVVFVYATICDSKNTTVITDNREVTFKVEGAQIIGPATIKAQAGTATVLIKTGTTPANITITASAAGLKNTSTKIIITNKLSNN
jgi:beta-galactosidase